MPLSPDRSRQQARSRAVQPGSALPDQARRSRSERQGRSRRRRSERGATLVEYSLLVALFAVGTIGGLTLLQDGAQATAQSSADRISTHSIPSTSAP